MFRLLASWKLGVGPGWALCHRVTCLALCKFVDVFCFVAHSWQRYKTTKRFGVDGGEAAVAGAVRTWWKVLKSLVMWPRGHGVPTHWKTCDPKRNCCFYWFLMYGSTRQCSCDSQVSMQLLRRHRRKRMECWLILGNSCEIRRSLSRFLSQAGRGWVRAIPISKHFSKSNPFMFTFKAATLGMSECVIGMPHRGRLNASWQMFAICECCGYQTWRQIASSIELPSCPQLFIQPFCSTCSCSFMEHGGPGLVVWGAHQRG